MGSLSIQVFLRKEFQKKGYNFRDVKLCRLICAVKNLNRFHKQA